MSDRPRFFDDLAGMAGGAFAAFAGLREEAEALVRAQIDEALRRLDLVRHEELDAIQELAANAHAAAAAAAQEIQSLRAELAELRASAPPDEGRRTAP